MAGVGDALKAYGDGLSETINKLIMPAIKADSTAKDFAFERTAKSLKLPPAKFDQYIMYESVNADGEKTHHVLKYFLLIPAVVFVDGRVFSFDSYKIKSEFEAMMSKETKVGSETNIGVGGSVGLGGVPSINFNASEKLTVDHSTGQSEKTTFAVDIEMGQGPEPIGKVEITNAVMKTVNKIFDFILDKGMENPQSISEDEAKQLTDQADAGVVGTEDAPSESSGQEQPQSVAE